MENAELNLQRTIPTDPSTDINSTFMNSHQSSFFFELDPIYNSQSTDTRERKPKCARCRNHVMAAQVALKRKQAAEDAIALGFESSAAKLPKQKLDSVDNCEECELQNCVQRKRKESCDKSAGRFPPIELQIVIPRYSDQESRVLELLLEGSDGEVLPAIENALCLRQFKLAGTNYISMDTCSSSALQKPSSGNLKLLPPKMYPPRSPCRHCLQKPPSIYLRTV
uniref:Uncharacterized protein n=1 Tax=Ditylenchus dipsaci TaxID=166011 RepID=A0A915DLA9_9BILA